MTPVVYEFPLNEKVRNYLRVEHLFTALSQPEKICEEHSEIQFFRDYFTLLELIERIDLRTELLRDLASYKSALSAWLEYPNIDVQLIQRQQELVATIVSKLMESKRVGQELKSDRFLTAIRQRFSIPGATCSFDLPKLHYWLSLDKNTKQLNFNQWLAPLLVLKDAVATTMQFIRGRSELNQFTVPNGFYQGIADNKVELIRVETQANTHYYPTLSGNKYRYAVRFMKFSQHDNDSSSVDQEITFMLASC